jgi:Uma2 family endonuclease
MPIITSPSWRLRAVCSARGHKPLLAAAGVTVSLSKIAIQGRPMIAGRSHARRNPPLMTADEFFDMPDDGTGTKYELVDGVLVAMAPTHPTHGRLQAALTYLISAHLRARKSPCWIATEIGVQPTIKANTNVRIPDIGVSCRPQVLSDKSMPEPVLLTEVLSPSTARGDQAKVWLYATMPSVQEILIIHSTEVRLEFYTRLTDRSWPKEAQIATTGQGIHFKCIDMALAVDELYDGIPLA